MTPPVQQFDPPSRLGELLLNHTSLTPEQLHYALEDVRYLLPLFEVERERPELLASLRQWIAAEPTIQQAWYVTGDDDYVLVVTARDVDDYDALMRRLVAANANVKRFRTRVALDTLKRGLAVPVDALPA